MRLHRFILGLGAILILCSLFGLWTSLQQPESALAIHPINQASMPDGFAISHHLNTHGIHFESIIPQNDALIVTFASSEQSRAAKHVLAHSLPHVYVITLQSDNNWLSRLRKTSKCFG